MTATWSGAGEGEQLWFLGTLAIVRVAGEASGGRFALIEFLFPRNASPPLHTHPQDESYIVQEGRLTLQAGEQRFGLVAVRQPWCRWGSRTPSAWTANVHGCSCSVRRQGLSVSYETDQSGAARPTLPPGEIPRPSPEQLEELFKAHGQVNVGPPLLPD